MSRPTRGAQPRRPEDNADLSSDVCCAAQVRAAFHNEIEMRGGEVVPNST